MNGHLNHQLFLSSLEKNKYMADCGSTCSRPPLICRTKNKLQIQNQLI
jgi:hypothetical protein